MLGLIKGKSVCQGNAEIIRNLCAEFGIEATVVRGKGIEGGGHAWNQVQLDGVWYDDDFTTYQNYLTSGQLDKCGAFLMGQVNGVSIAKYNNYVAYSKTHNVGKNLSKEQKRNLLSIVKENEMVNEEQEKQREQEKSIRDEVGDEFIEENEQQELTSNEDRDLIQNSLLESAVEATEKNVRIEDINKQAQQIKKIQQEKEQMQNIEQGVQR